jgi:aminopeptidase N
MDVDVYFGGAVNRYRIDLDQQEKTFEFDVLGKPSLVNVDAEKMVLGKKEEKLSDSEYLFMLKNAPLYMDRFEALAGLKSNSSPEVVDALLQTLEDEYWGIRRKALQTLKGKAVADTSLYKNRLIWLAQKDEKSAVRAEAISVLVSEFGKDPLVRSAIEGCMKDRSYMVLGATINAIASYDEEKAISIAKSVEADAGGSMFSAIGSLYAKVGGAEQFGFFEKAIENVSDPNEKYAFVQIFGKYLMRQDAATQLKGIGSLEDVALNSGAWWMRLSAIQVLMGINQTADPTGEVAKRVDTIITQVKSSETNQMIKGMLGE